MSAAPTLEDLSVDIESFEASKAADIYREHGCVVVRGLNRQYVDRVVTEADAIAAQSLKLMADGEYEELDKKDFPKGGWVSHDGTLFIPCSEDYSARVGRPWQPMVLGMDYYTSAVMFQAATDEHCLDLVEEILGPDIELYGKGQVLYKEPAGGFPKLLHQDGAYFEFKMDGPVGTLNYACDCTTDLDNGPLYVVPGSHRDGYIRHVDTESHLAVPEKTYSFEEAVAVNGKAGDTLFFHVHTVHGSTPNRSATPRATFINRYTHPDDVQTIHATSEALREAGEKGQAEVPVKERNYLVRGRRKWTGVKWDLPVQHH